MILAWLSIAVMLLPLWALCWVLATAARKREERNRG